MTNEEPKSSEPVAENKSFIELVSPLLVDLLYPSESDEPVEAVTCYLKQAEPLTVSQIMDWQMLPPGRPIEELTEADFWEPVTTEEDWYGPEEKIRTSRFQEIKQLVDSMLTERQVFRVGEVEMDVFLLGREENGERAGLKTKIVQT